MKTYTISALLLVITSLVSTAQGLANHEDRQLIYGMDFNGYNYSTAGLPIVNKALEENAGGSTFTKINGNNFNYATDITGVPGSEPDYLFAHQFAGATFSLSDSNGIGGITAGRGFSIVFAAHNANTKWRNLMGFEYGGIKFQFQFGGGDGLNLYNSAGLSSLDLGSAGFNQEWATYALSVQGNQLTYTAVAKDGSVLSRSLTLSGIEEDALKLTQVIGGGNIDYEDNGVLRNSGEAQMDNLAIYNGHLDQEHIIQIAQYSFAGNGLLQIIPEPTTASMSILALAGLLGRRRRKQMMS